MVLCITWRVYELFRLNQQVTKIEKRQGEKWEAQILATNLISSPNGVTEKQCAIRAADGKSWWIISHEKQSDKFYVLKFLDGVLSPVNIQSIGPNMDFSPWNSNVGELVQNPNGSKIALIGGKSISLFDFDRCSGQISNWQPIDTLNSSEFSYGGSFSQDGKKLFVSTVGVYNSGVFPPQL